mmetsp:Transcript_1632/g.3777  ORF Transcript_1632/g.3777 Transcript_1632/m.3777 type:complete len:245 (-) Transcript_1632:912-1646(-)
MPSAEWLGFGCLWLDLCRSTQAGRAAAVSASASLLHRVGGEAARETLRRNLRRPQVRDAVCFLLWDALSRAREPFQGGLDLLPGEEPVQVVEERLGRPVVEAERLRQQPPPGPHAAVGAPVRGRRRPKGAREPPLDELRHGELPAAEGGGPRGEEGGLDVGGRRVLDADIPCAVVFGVLVGAALGDGDEGVEGRPGDRVDDGAEVLARVVGVHQDVDLLSPIDELRDLGAELLPCAVSLGEFRD